MRGLLAQRLLAFVRSVGFLSAQILKKAKLFWDTRNLQSKFLCESKIFGILKMLCIFMKCKYSLRISRGHPSLKTLLKLFQKLNQLFGFLKVRASPDTPPVQ